jgi:hypothetical protein
MKERAQNTRARTRARYLLTMAIALLLPLGLTGAALAQGERLGGKVRSGSDVVIPADETAPYDVYLTGGTIRVEGRVEGDVVAAGGRIEIPGAVTGDVVVAGGNVTVSGQVEGDVRVATGQLSVTGTVGEDVFVAGGQVAVPGRIGEDFIFYSGQTSLNGTVAGNVLGATGEYTRRGTVAGTEEVTVDEREKEEPPTPLDRLLDVVRRYFGILLVGALFLWLAPRVTHDAAWTVRRRLLPSLGWGFLAIVGFLVLFIATILATILVSLPLGLLGLGGLVATMVFAGILFGALTVFGFVLLVGFVAHAVVALSIGGPVVRAGEGALRGRGLAGLALGLLLVVALISIPFVGGFIAFVVALAGLGGLLLAARGGRPTPVAVAEVPPPAEPT